MSENPTEVVVESPTPDVQVVVEPAPPEVFVNVEPSVPDVTTTVDAEPEIVIVGVQDQVPDIVVEVAEVGLVGPGGPPGPPGINAGGADDPSVNLNVIEDMIDTNIQTHVDDPLPHPAYDDGLSLALLYQNAKV